MASSADQPLLIHCTAGKDRTGITTAFVLSILGVPEEIIVADYLLTNRDVPRQVEFLDKNDLLPEGVDTKLMAHHAGVPETAMKDFLDGMDQKYGGSLSYLESIGVSNDTFDKIRRLRFYEVAPLSFFTNNIERSAQTVEGCQASFISK